MSDIDQGVLEQDLGMSPSPPTREKFRLLVVDEEEVILRDARKQFGADPDICLVTAATQDAALRAVGKYYFDAAMIDIELDVPAGGYEVMREFAEVAPGTPLVVMTKHVDPAHVRELVRLVNPWPPRIAGIIDKAPLSKPGHDAATWMRPAVASIIEEWRSSRVELINEDLALELLEARADRIPGYRDDPEEIATELDRICRCLFGDISGLAEGSGIGIELSPIGSPGLSSAIAVEATVRLGEDLSGEPVTGSRCVLKIGPVAGIREEVERYGRFVKFGVRLTQRVELLDHTYHHALGAVCYSFAGGVFGDALVSLDELLRSSGDSDLASAAIAELFALSSQSWYAVQCDGISARTYISQTYETDFGECFKSLEGTLNKLQRRLRRPDLQKALGGYVAFEKPDDGTDGMFELGGKKLAIPRRNVLGDGRLISAIPACLVHGDMHGGNVMLELSRASAGNGASADVELRRVCLIDYRSSGPGPRAVDAVALQASLRLADARSIVAEVAPDVEPDSLADVQLAKAIRIAVSRVDDDVAALEEMWKGRSADEAPPSWRAVDSQIAAATLENFTDLTCSEYLAIAVPFTLQQIGYRIDAVARVRMLAWLSAQYRILREGT